MAVMTTGRSPRIRHIATGLVLCLTLMSFACASIGTHKTIPLEERAQTLVRTYIDGDDTTRYSLYSPAFRAKMTLQGYRSIRRPVFEHVSLGNVTRIDDTHASVIVNMEMNLAGFEFKKATLAHKFIRIDGQWYIDDEPFKGF